MKNKKSMLSLISLQKLNDYDHRYEMRLFFKGADVNSVNTFRRILINDIPIYAIDMVRFDSNESPLSAADTAHRLGLIPVVNRLLNKKNKKTYYICDLDITNDTDEPMRIFSDEIELLDANEQKTGIYPMMIGIKIVEILPGNTLSWRMYISKEKGEKHIKYKCCKAFYFEKDDGYEMVIKTFGNLEPKKIIRKALKIYEKSTGDRFNDPF